MAMMLPQLRNRVTPRRRLPDALKPVRLGEQERRLTHMVASLLLDYPDAEWFARLDQIVEQARQLPAPIWQRVEAFVATASAAGPMGWQRRYVTTFDLKRKCSLYLSYFATGDTRRRGTALVTFKDAYRAAGWELAADELPDYLPMVLEFSARTGDPIAQALLAAHIEGIEVLRAALESMDSPWADLIAVVTLSLPPVDQATQERVLELVTQGPPTELVGLTSLGNLAPFSAREDR